MPAAPAPRVFATLGMFIIDEFASLDDAGTPTARTLAPQGRAPRPAPASPASHAHLPRRSAAAAPTPLPPAALGMIVDKGADFPAHILDSLNAYGEPMWLYRDHPDRPTTRALNEYKGDHRGFEYLTPRIRITPRDLADTPLARPQYLHFICSPSRARAIMADVEQLRPWAPTTIYEPIPDRCVPEELPALVAVLPPNAEEALALLSMPLPATKPAIEDAAARLLALGVGPGRSGWVIVRSGALGAYVASRQRRGEWVDAYWAPADAPAKVVDVTGAGNSFLGGLAAGMALTGGDVFKSTFYGAVSASFTIEQQGLPRLHVAADGTTEEWNGDSPRRRLDALEARHARAHA
ncbi:hypothetical protein HETIRDRAFT_314466 [Heterobasidion irregulare TC 32-1]|uniref:Carbohydrate kinase PfkB domain-containing protein n=1 Tax=Heterobasidion irregulare (strain TC 32-1) TaxID=747525 RepID=W4KF52_HETIT|nr:uncharacterized protein HETIRDRAFT_314466 [Heterobasidion irregulare TC 32-1]ETW84344.1 hypothetical protein HETIRDRAFT_314466 [Heterobasidion irregulare TC 32-1]